MTRIRLVVFLAISLAVVVMSTFLSSYCCSVASLGYGVLAQDTTSALTAWTGRWLGGFMGALVAVGWCWSMKAPVLSLLDPVKIISAGLWRGAAAGLTATIVTHLAMAVISGQTDSMTVTIGLFVGAVSGAALGGLGGLCFYGFVPRGARAQNKRPDVPAENGNEPSP